jgi:SpoVK/Ycf46/Vps4 family AAA+-type ATPase
MQTQSRINLNIDIPTASEKDIFLLKTKIGSAVESLISKKDIDVISILIKEGELDNLQPNQTKAKESMPIEIRAENYQSRQPIFRFDKLILPERVRDNILISISLIEKEKHIFDIWGLREIEPFPRTVLNFYGPPGTGKTFAAHAIAHKLGKNILVATYADIESMYHGVGPQNLEAIFYAAERDKAVLFIDEADSLLSKRLKNVTQGSEQAINSMRSQLLLCLEKFKGISIFSTNLVENYDKAFETRVKHILFPHPDESCRRDLWKIHLPEKLPLVDICLDSLAKVDDICGRDIKNAVVTAALEAAFHDRQTISHTDLMNAIQNIKNSKITSETTKPTTLKPFVVPESATPCADLNEA